MQFKGIARDRFRSVLWSFFFRRWHVQLYKKRCETGTWTFFTFPYSTAWISQFLLKVICSRWDLRPFFGMGGRDQFCYSNDSRIQLPAKEWLKCVDSWSQLVDLLSIRTLRPIAFNSIILKGNLSIISK